MQLLFDASTGNYRKLNDFKFTFFAVIVLLIYPLNDQTLAMQCSCCLMHQRLSNASEGSCRDIILSLHSLLSFSSLWCTRHQQCNVGGFVFDRTKDMSKWQESSGAFAPWYPILEHLLFTQRKEFLNEPFFLKRAAHWCLVPDLRVVPPQKSPLQGEWLAHTLCGGRFWCGTALPRREREHMCSEVPHSWGEAGRHMAELAAALYKHSFVTREANEGRGAGM